MSSDRVPVRAERASRPGYIAAIIVNVVLLYVAHHLLEWHVPFVTQEFTVALWAVDLSLIATIVGNAMLLGYDARWFKRLVQIALNVVAVAMVATLYGIFPFDFGYSGDRIARICLWAMMLALGIATIVEAVHRLLNKD